MKESRCREVELSPNPTPRRRSPLDSHRLSGPEPVHLCPLWCLWLRLATLLVPAPRALAGRLGLVWSSPLPSLHPLQPPAKNRVEGGAEAGQGDLTPSPAPLRGCAGLPCGMQAPLVRRRTLESLACSAVVCAWLPHTMWDLGFPIRIELTPPALESRFV